MIRKPSFVAYIIPAFVLLISSVCSCKKSALELSFLSIPSGTQHHLYNIQLFNKDTLYVCGGNEGKGIVLRSVDGGITWETLNANFTRTLRSICFLSSTKGFAGADSAFVYRTDDGGKTWNEHIDYTGVPYQYRKSLHNVIFTDSLNGYFAGGNDFGRGIIYYTHDGGNKWNTFGLEHELRGVASGLNGICAVGYGAVLLSDNGTDFQLLRSDNAYYTGLVLPTSNAGWACSYNGGLYATTNGGKSFNNVKKENHAVSSREHFLCIDVKNNRVIASGHSGVTSLSSDGGATFKTGYSLNETRINAVKLLPSNKTICVGSNGKIFLADY